MSHRCVNPVRNSSGALNPTEVILKPNPVAEQWGIISNGVKEEDKRKDYEPQGFEEEEDQ